MAPAGGQSRPARNSFYLRGIKMSVSQDTKRTGAHWIRSPNPNIVPYSASLNLRRTHLLALPPKVEPYPESFLATGGHRHGVFEPGRTTVEIPRSSGRFRRPTRLVASAYFGHAPLSGIPLLPVATERLSAQADKTFSPVMIRLYKKVRWWRIVKIDGLSLFDSV